MTTARPALLALLVLISACHGDRKQKEDAGVPPVPMRAPPPPAWSEEIGPVSVSSADPQVGDRTAPATIVAFMDFECQWSARAAPTLRGLMDTYGPRQLRIVWKNFTIDPSQVSGSAVIGEAIFELGHQDAYNRYYDAAFPFRPGPRNGRPEWIKRSGITPARIQSQIDTGYPLGKVTADQALGKRLGITGTPTFYVNGVVLAGAQPKEKFQELIDRTVPRPAGARDAGTDAAPR